MYISISPSAPSPRLDEDEPVPAHAEAAVGQGLGGLDRIGHLLAEQVHVDVIVAGAVHLDELHVSAFSTPTYQAETVLSRTTLTRLSTASRWPIASVSPCLDGVLPVARARDRRCTGCRP